MRQDQVPDLIVVEERTRDHMVDMDEFACERFLAIETEAVLIAIEYRMRAGDVNALIACRAVKHVLVGAKHFHRFMHGEGGLEQIGSDCGVQRFLDTPLNGSYLYS